VGTHVLGLQMYALGLSDSETLDPSGPLVRQLMALYEAMGDTIALQYGGSEANKKVTTDEHAEAVLSAQERGDQTDAVQVGGGEPGGGGGGGRREGSGSTASASLRSGLSVLFGSSVSAAAGVLPLGGGAKPVSRLGGNSAT